MSVQPTFSARCVIHTYRADTILLYEIHPSPGWKILGCKPGLSENELRENAKRIGAGPFGFRFHGKLICDNDLDRFITRSLEQAESLEDILITPGLGALNCLLVYHDEARAVTDPLHLREINKACVTTTDELEEWLAEARKIELAKPPSDSISYAMELDQRATFTRRVAGACPDGEPVISKGSSRRTPFLREIYDTGVSFISHRSDARIFADRKEALAAIPDELMHNICCVTPLDDRKFYIVVENPEDGMMGWIAENNAVIYPMAPARYPDGARLFSSAKAAEEWGVLNIDSHMWGGFRVRKTIEQEEIA